MAHRKLTPARLLDTCESLLSSGAVTLAFLDCNKKYDAFCETEYDPDGTPSSCAITVDPSRVGYLPGILHELLHAILLPVTKTMNTTMEEYIVRTLEERLWQKHFTPARVMKWRKLARNLLTQGALDVASSQGTRASRGAKGARTQSRLGTSRRVERHRRACHVNGWSARPESTS